MLAHFGSTTDLAVAERTGRACLLLPGSEDELRQAVALTERAVAAGRPGREFAYQFDTLVVGVHRGHGLGMLVKLANLVELAEVAPERAVVYTWNADENDHMLAINIALGFRRRGLEAAWQRELPATADAHD